MIVGAGKKKSVGQDRLKPQGEFICDSLEAEFLLLWETWFSLIRPPTD